VTAYEPVLTISYAVCPLPEPQWPWLDWLVGVFFLHSFRLLIFDTQELSEEAL
jgi:hypothetical protein